MAFPKEPVQRYTASRQLISGNTINNLSDMLDSAQTSNGALVAAGNSQATAAKIDAANVEIAATSPVGGAVLPVSYPGAKVNILNNSLNTTTIYGNGTDTVQNAGTTYAASVTMATLVSATFLCIKKGFWQRVVTG